MGNFQITSFLLIFVSCQIISIVNGGSVLAQEPNLPRLRPPAISNECNNELQKYSDQLQKCYDDTKAAARKQLEKLDLSEKAKINAIMCPAIKTIQNCYDVAKVIFNLQLNLA